MVISSTNWTLGVNQVQVTVENTVALISTDLTGVRFSLDGTSYANFLQFDEVGTYTVYVRCRGITGTYADAVHWQEYLDEGSWSVTISGGTTRQYESISMSLNPRASTIQYSAEQVGGNLNLNETVTGNILDHQFGFEVERFSQQGQRKSIAGAFQATKLVESLITYQVRYDWHWSILTWTRPTFLDHINEISSAIGIPIVYSGANFYPKTDMNFLLRKSPFDIDFYEKISGAFSDILNRLIGWTSDVPAMTINLYVENGTIYLVQRGYESTTRIPDAIVMHPVLTFSKRHTEWANSMSQTVVPKEIASSDTANSSSPFSGTISFGTASLTYEDGLLVSETNSNTVTVYTYTTIRENKYLSQKVATTTDPDTGDTTVATTIYSYATTEVDIYLASERLTVVDADNETITDRLTSHSPIGNGWYGTSTKDLLDDEAVVADSLSQGSPGNAVSQYMIDNQNDSLKSTNQQSPRNLTVELNGVPKARATYPVADLPTLQSIANCLDNYEGKTEVQIQLELVGGSHIYNYSDKFTYDGQDYFLVSNSVTMTGDKLRQNIVGVRWVLS